ncbi:MAG: hypothetical protein FWH01_08025 [Oscillospiraceae bacterium]|nr:hypothetical protein [Oscillospiraceae bacterium]
MSSINKIPAATFTFCGYVAPAMLLRLRTVGYALAATFLRLCTCGYTASATHL